MKEPFPRLLPWVERDSALREIVIRRIKQCGCATLPIDPGALLAPGSTWERGSIFNFLMRAVPVAVPAEWKAHSAPWHAAFWDLDCGRAPASLKRLEEWGAYKPAPPGLRGIFQVHPIHVIRALGGPLECFGDVVAANPTLYAYEVAGLFMWWGLMPAELRQHFLDIGLHRVDVNTHAKELQARLEVVRQQGVGCSCHLGRDLFLWLRKFGNLKGRSVGRVDRPLELYRSKPGYAHRVMGDRHGAATRREYVVRLRGVLREIAHTVVARMCRDGATRESPDEWWARRVHTAPGGSSSLRHILDPYRGKVPEIRNKDRPNKKCVVEALPDDFWFRCAAQPPCQHGRQSVKNEPGKKHRALYAADDECSFVAAYASAGMEKRMNVLGMCPQQRPGDILAWWREHERRKDGGCWMSVDFTDFNKEHSALELYELNKALCEAWFAHGGAEAGTKWKAYAAAWTAASHLMRFIRTDTHPEGERVLSGLWSGHRDTARDNTMLHCAYQRLTVAWLDRELPGWGQLNYVQMCGDDEDAHFNSPMAAALYYSALRYLGWHLNPAKQLAGTRTHEFLQRVPDQHAGCLGPVSSMIAALASGQWYKVPGYQQDLAIGSISDQVWELVVRGAELKVALRLGEQLLNAYMRVPTSGGPRKLEWWRFRGYPHTGGSSAVDRFSQKAEASHTALRGAAPAGHVLWGEVGARTGGQKAPAAFYTQQRTHGLPGRAAGAWARKMAPLFAKYAPGRLTAYGEELKAASYGPLFHGYIQGEKLRYLQEEWPARTTTREEREGAIRERLGEHDRRRPHLREQQAELLTVLQYHACRATPPSDPQLLAAAGCDIIAFTMMGGWHNPGLIAELGLWKHARVRRRSWLEQFPHLAYAAELLDPALRSFLKSTGPGGT